MIITLFFTALIWLLGIVNIIIVVYLMILFLKIKRKLSSKFKNICTVYFFLFICVGFLGLFYGNLIQTDIETTSLQKNIIVENSFGQYITYVTVLINGIIDFLFNLFILYYFIDFRKKQKV